MGGAVVVAAAVLAVLASLAAVGRCDHAPKTTASPAPRLDEDRDEVETTSLCDDVVVADTAHVPAYTDQHRRLLQVHVRSNLRVRTAWRYL